MIGQSVGMGTTAMAAFVMAACSLARATTIDVTIDSTSLSGQPAVLAFDFIDGGPPANTVTLSALTSNGTLDSTSSTGNVSGSGPWIFSDAGPSFFNELQVKFNPMGTSLSFSFTTTDNASSAGSLPDAFSLYVLDSSGALPLITTDDPTGADALFLFNLGAAREHGGPFTPNEAGFSITATPVPEPGSAALVLWGALGLAVRLRKLRSRPTTGGRRPGARPRGFAR